MEDPLAACEKAGVKLPQGIFFKSIVRSSPDHSRDVTPCKIRVHLWQDSLNFKIYP